MDGGLELHRLSSFAGAMEALAKLEKLQTQLLQRISNLEFSVLSQHSSQNLSMKIAFPAFFANDFSFKRVPSDYDEWPLEAHSYIVSDASIHYLWKRIVLVPPCFALRLLFYRIVIYYSIYNFKLVNVKLHNLCVLNITLSFSTY